jgi:hypothetical protein
MFAQPIPIVHHVGRRRRVLGRKVLVAPAAIAERPLIAVLVASEADRHLRLERLGLRVARRGVAAHAVPVHGRHVLPVIEAEVAARELGGPADVRGSVAVEARPRVVRARVAAEAVGSRGEMERLVVAVARDLRVARHAVDPFGGVGAMLEGVGRVAALETEDPRAGGERESEEQQERQPLHGSSRERAMRARTFVS